MRSRRWRRSRRRLARWDKQLLAGAVRRRSPASNRVMTTASGMANHSKVWIAFAALLASTGRRRPRTAAASGLLGIGIAATLVNGPLKFAWRRDRPPILLPGGEPLLPLPRTFSFPSGHSASALAFATGVTSAMPALGPVVVPAGATVAYSRVHTGVHYPSDVAVGAAFGVASGLIGARVMKRMRASSVHRPQVTPLDVAVPRHALILHSDQSGASGKFEAALSALESCGINVERVFSVDEADELAEAIRSREDCPLVIAAGGDGTVSAAANAVAGADAVLAVIPLGTSNDVARSLGVPPDPREAALALASGQVCRVDVARLTLADGQSRVFLNAATVGLNVAFARLATDKGLRDQFGGLTYPVAAARAVRGYEPFECTVDHDGKREKIRAVHFSASNAPVFGGVLGMRVPGASITDGKLDVTIVERLSKARLALAVLDTMIGQHRPVHGVHTMRVSSIHVEASATEQVALDGEVLGTLPADFEIEPAGIRVVVPEA